MNLALERTPIVSLADTLSVVDAVLGAIDRRLPAHVSRDDLASAGKLALVEALLNFDGPSEQVRAYCYVRVRGAVLDELRRLDPLSRYTRRRVVVVQRAVAGFERQFGRVPTLGEVAALTGFPRETVAQLEQLASAARVISVDATDEDGECLHAIPDASAAGPAGAAESDDLHASIRAALDRLAPRYAQVLRRYYLDEATLEDIAAELGVSKERVRQIREKAEQKLREDFVVLALWQAVLNRG
ncbi:MAG: sigma-70 family RNA polymerase sigma factor [Verrucomicrobia bacterium]|nr:sigma-70 family RNA polymerase sigma factor [Verrucomicrobiota bacterium]